MNIAKNLMVPESYKPVSHAFQSLGSLGVVCSLIIVLSTICFNNQFGFQACEVDNVWLYYRLASEFVSHQSLRPQILP